MVSKYSNLPDIDLSSQDVYEYGGAGDDDQISVVHPFESKSNQIDNSKLKPQESVQIFENSQVDASSSDFSGKVDERLPRAYNIRTAESREVRIARLKRELEEIASEIDGSETERTNVGELHNVLEKLSLKKNKIDSVKFYSDLGRKENGTEAKLSLPTSTEHIAAADLSDLEQRLHTLETKLGIVNYEQSPPIISTLTYLRERISFLTASPANLDRAVNNLKQLTAETEKLKNEVTVKITSIENPADDDTACNDEPSAAITAYNHAHQINTIYNSIPLLQSVHDQVPLIIQRLESLQTIHADASVVVSTVRDVETTLASLQKGIDQWKDSIEGLEKRIQQYQEKSELNVQRVKEWIATVEERLR